MLYLKKKVSPTCVFAIWKIEESQKELVSMLNPNEAINAILSIKSEKRVLEKLITLHLLHLLTGADQQILYNPSGRPYLVDEKWHISISHTKGYVAVIVDQLNHVGIDIEQISNKIKNVRSRIVSDREYINDENELVHLLLHWSAKETMFKMIGEEGIDFLSHLHIMPFSPQKEGSMVAKEYKTYKRKSFTIHYQVEKDFVLTYAIDLLK